MKNSDMPAMPIPTRELGDRFLSGEKGGKTFGLTKREHFAGLAMQGFAADGATEWSCGVGSIAKEAVRWADALLAELEEGSRE